MPVQVRTAGYGRRVSEVLEAAHADVAQGKAWRACDLLRSHVTTIRDDEALTLLGGILYSMGDLPGAGAAWFGTSRKGLQVDEAVRAWREHHGDHFGAMWRSLPASVRKDPRVPRAEALREKAMTVDEGADPTPAPSVDSGVDGAVVIAWVVAALLLVCTVVGLVTILEWMVGG